MTMFASVVFPLPLDQEFTYRVPDELQSKLAPGSIVAAPFRNSLKTGFVSSVSSAAPSFAVKDLRDILFDKPVFREDLSELARWMSSYYYVSKGEIFELMLPVKINRESYELITPGLLTPPPDEMTLSVTDKKILDIVRERKKVTAKTIRQVVGRYNLYNSLDKLKRNNLITIRQYISSKNLAPKTHVYFRPVISISEKKQGSVFSRAPLQKKVYNYICDHNPAQRSLLVKKIPGPEQALGALLKKGLVEKMKKEIVREYMPKEIGENEKLPQLKKDQQALLDSLRRQCEAGGNNIFLLHGVTGSGKTRIYMDLIHETLQKGDGALFLVPEIALTDYFLAGFRAQFGSQVAVQHSRMSSGERYDSWRGIISGQKRVVIGPRSAVFAPVDRLKLIIVDEEHDNSYKQHESPPYYHARDVAVYRGRINEAVVVLGSATPSMESYYNAINEKYALLELPKRIDDVPMPEVRLISMKNNVEEHKFEKKPIFSDTLIDEISHRLKHDEQVLVMQNRRGYSTFISCRSCGFIETCEHCNISLTFHKKTKKIVCHFCGSENSAPVSCRECMGTNIQYSGIGTQQVEEALNQHLPEYQTIRMDLDTTRSKRAHQRITGDFERGESDILVGTQMVAKGFDFSRVNLVGIVSADTGLLLPDFRASEKTFQLLTQAAGRAGRRKQQGLVLIQTQHSGHYCLNAVINHDYQMFYELESGLRKELDYPPFGRIIVLRFSGQNENEVSNAAEKVGRELRKTRVSKYLLGPAPAPIEKIRNRYRWLIFLRSGKTEDTNAKLIRDAARSAKNIFKRFSLKNTVSMTIDVDPVNLL
jgi:primosomal protein N' (replication factor Y)